VGDLVRSFRAMLERPEMEVTYNFAHQERYSSEDICDAFVQVAGFSPPKVVFPISLMLLVGLGFEILGKLGLKTSINRARIMKLNRSTNIVPRRLQEFGFSYAFNLEGSLKDWRKMSASGNFD
jgi:hypothetical protein